MAETAVPSASGAPGAGASTPSPPALKEWAVVCDLLLAGRQSVLFRKGGISEKGFWVEAPDFYLFPTYFHQNRDKVRAEHLADFDRAMEAAPPEDVLRMSAYARVFDAIEVRRPDRIAELRDLHPYTDEQIAMRVEFRPKKPLVILVAKVFGLTVPSVSPMHEGYGGCLSWVEVGLPAPRVRAPVKPDQELRAIAERVRATVG